MSDTNLFFEYLSALQKNIRRGKEEDVLTFALGLENFNATALWNRLKVIAIEDIGLASPTMPILIETLHKHFINAGLDSSRLLFLTNAIVCLCRSPKSRITDDLLNVVQLEQKRLQIPDYALDMHTARGRNMGRSWTYFFDDGTKVENEILENPYKERHRKLRRA